LEKSLRAEETHCVHALLIRALSYEMHCESNTRQPKEKEIVRFICKRVKEEEQKSQNNNV